MLFKTYQWTSFLIGVFIAAAIFYLVRKDRMHIRYAFWWTSVAVASLALGAFPPIVDWVADKLGVAYPPVLLLTVAVAMTLIKILTMDIERSDLERKIRRLSQRLAILEGEDRSEKD